jgi:hypothetical protein
MRLVEADYAPTLIVGIRTGGLIVAQAMALAATPRLPVFPLTCRRVTTDAKSRLPLLRTLLGILPRPVVNLLPAGASLCHRGARAPRPAAGGRPRGAAAIGDHLAALPSPARILIADDAVNSGVTLATVLRLVSDVCPVGDEIRSAAITQTLENPTARPDYLLFRGTLCRFPWSFDAAE